ncbi:MAG TPA: aminotransferase class IV [Bacteroidales bacterium]|nr:aminotransferase class IV [Bacteroidales bacterium]
MSECVSKEFIENGIVRDRADFDLSKIFENEVIYEVIRIREGIPVFLHDHYQRLVNSASLNGNKLLYGFDELKGQILKLIELSDIVEGNIKISLKYSESYTGCLVYYVDAQYPGPEMYVNGVKGILYYAERRNPVIKIFNHKLRSSIYNKLIQTNAYEALLVNRNGYITEGSRSNIFFIKDNEIITAPDDCVLGGITRKKILAIIKNEEFNIDFRCLHIDELGTVDSLFMTGTSPDVLPFKEIENYSYTIENDMLNLITGKYKSLIDFHLRKFNK